eukprot:UN26117
MGMKMCSYDNQSTTTKLIKTNNKNSSNPNGDTSEQYDSGTRYLERSVYTSLQPKPLDIIPEAATEDEAETEDAKSENSRIYKWNNEEPQSTKIITELYEGDPDTETHYISTDTETNGADDERSD